MEYLREIYSAEDLFYLHESVAELISALKQSPYLLDEVTPRQFEEIVAEVFRSKKGFKVDLTKRTRDGGKDIIAIHTDEIGIKNKYFIECKRYAESNKVSVEVVRSLYGVMNTADGPNKAIIVTTSTFTEDARKFVAQEARSSWDLALVDRAQLLDWLFGYRES
nr:restriction endonuclease [Ferrimonas balearica]